MRTASLLCALLALAAAAAVHAASVSLPFPASLQQGVATTATISTDNFSGAEGARVNVTCSGGTAGSITVTPSTFICLQDNLQEVPLTFLASTNAAGDFTCTRSLVFGAQARDFAEDVADTATVSVTAVVPLTVTSSLSSSAAAPQSVFSGQQFTIDFQAVVGAGATALVGDVHFAAFCNSLLLPDNRINIQYFSPANSGKASATFSFASTGLVLCTFAVSEESDPLDYGKLRNVVLAPAYFKVLPQKALTVSTYPVSGSLYASPAVAETFPVRITAPAAADTADNTFQLNLDCSSAGSATSAQVVASAGAGSNIEVSAAESGSNYAIFSKTSTGDATYTITVPIPDKQGLGVAVQCSWEFYNNNGAAVGNPFALPAPFTFLVGQVNPASTLTVTAPHGTVVMASRTLEFLANRSSLVADVAQQLIVSSVVTLNAPNAGVDFGATDAVNFNTAHEEPFTYYAPQSYSLAQLLVAGPVTGTLTFSLTGFDAMLYRTPAPLQLTFVQPPPLVLTGVPSTPVPSTPTTTTVNVVMLNPSFGGFTGNVGGQLYCDNSVSIVTTAVTAANASTVTVGDRNFGFTDASTTDINFAITVNSPAANDGIFVRCSWGEGIGGSVGFLTPGDFSFVVGSRVQLVAVTTSLTVPVGGEIQVRVNTDVGFTATINSYYLQVTLDCSNTCAANVAPKQIVPQSMSKNYYSSASPFDGTTILPEESGLVFYINTQQVGTQQCVFKLLGTNDDGGHFIAPAPITLVSVARKTFNVTATGGLASPVVDSLAYPGISYTPTLLPMWFNETRATYTVTVQAPGAALSLYMGCSSNGDQGVTAVSGGVGVSVHANTATWTADSVAPAQFIISVQSASEEYRYSPQDVRCSWAFDGDQPEWALPPVISFRRGSAIALRPVRGSGIDVTDYYQKDTNYPFYYTDRDYFGAYFRYNLQPDGENGDNSFLLGNFRANVTCTRDHALPGDEFDAYNWDNGVNLDNGELVASAEMTFNDEERGYVGFGVYSRQMSLFTFSCVIDILPRQDGLPQVYSLEPRPFGLTMSPSPNRLVVTSSLPSLFSATAGLPDSAPSFQPALGPGGSQQFQITVQLSKPINGSVLQLGVRCRGSSDELSYDPQARSFGSGTYFYSDAYDGRNGVTANSTTFSMTFSNSDNRPSADYNCVLYPSALNPYNQADDDITAALYDFGASFAPFYFNVVFGQLESLQTVAPTVIYAQPSQQTFSFPTTDQIPSTGELGSLASKACFGTAAYVYQLKTQCVGPSSDASANFQFLDGGDSRLNFPLAPRAFFLNPSEVGEYRCTFQYDRDEEDGNDAYNIALRQLAPFVFTAKKRDSFVVTGMPATVTEGAKFTLSISPSATVLATRGGVTVEITCSGGLIADSTPLFFFPGSTSAAVQTLSVTVGPRVSTQKDVDELVISKAQAAYEGGGGDSNVGPVGCMVNPSNYNLQAGSQGDLLAFGGATQFEAAFAASTYGEPLRTAALTIAAGSLCGSATLTVTLSKAASTPIRGQVYCTLLGQPQNGGNQLVLGVNPTPGENAQRFDVEVPAGQTVGTLAWPEASLSAGYDCQLQVRGYTNPEYDAYLYDQTFGPVVHVDFGTPITVSVVPPSSNAGLSPGKTSGAFSVTLSSAPKGAPLTIQLVANGVALSKDTFVFAADTTTLTQTFTVSVASTFAQTSILLAVVAFDPNVIVPAPLVLRVSSLVVFSAVMTPASLMLNSPFQFDVSNDVFPRVDTTVTVSCSGLTAVGAAAATFGYGEVATKSVAFRTSAAAGSATCSFVLSGPGALFATVPAARSINWSASGSTNGTTPDGSSSGTNGGTTPIPQPYNAAVSVSALPAIVLATIVALVAMQM